MLPRKASALDRDIYLLTYHPRAGKHVPAEAYAIPIFNLPPLLLQSFVIHADL
jgi:hypothetical protein